MTTAPSPHWILRITMDSDWHVGTGSGIPGHIDRLLARDGDGLPYLPAKTVTGLWRDALEQLVENFDIDKGKNDPKPWHQWLIFLFGSQPTLENGPMADPPTGAVLSIGPGRLPEAYRARLELKSMARFRRALTFVKPGIEIDPASGRAKDRHLRFVEMGRVKDVFEAPVTCVALDEKVLDLTTALLAASAGLITRIGGKRRRGSGRCRALLVAAGSEVNSDNAIGCLKTYFEPAVTEPQKPPARSRPRLSPAPFSAGRPRPGPGAGRWRRVRLRLTLEQPMVVAAAVVGNVVETMRRIPGTLLIPAIRNALPELLGEDGTGPQAAFDTRLTGGRLRVLDATPSLGLDRGRPAPLTIECEKGRDLSDAKGSRNRLIEVEQDSPGLAQQGAYLGVVRPSAEAGMAIGPVFPQVPIVSRTHNSVHDEKQRPIGAEEDNEGEGEAGRGSGVYSYEALAPGLELHSALLLHVDGDADDDDLAGRLSAALERRGTLQATVSIGRARKDDYGTARLVFEPQQAAPEAQPPEPSGELFVWLLSDLSLRNRRLRPSADLGLLTAALKAALARHGAPLPNLAPMSCEPPGEPVGWRGRAFRREGWHAGAGLPRPSQVGLAAGTAIRFCYEEAEGVDETALSTALAAIEAEGLGDRRAEGFGEISFNDPFLTQKLAEAAPGRLIRVDPRPWVGRDDNGPITADDQALHESAGLVERAAWRAAITEQAQAVMALEEKRRKLGLGTNGPSASQLGRLREVVSRFREEKDKKMLEEFFEQIEKIKNQMESWQAVIAAIREMLQDKGKVWSVLSEAGDRRVFAERAPCLTASDSKQLRQKLWPDAVRALLTEAIREHVRQAQSGTEGDSGTGTPAQTEGSAS